MHMQRVVLLLPHAPLAAGLFKLAQPTLWEGLWLKHVVDQTHQSGITLYQRCVWSNQAGCCMGGLAVHGTTRQKARIEPPGGKRMKSAVGCLSHPLCFSSCLACSAVPIASNSSITQPFHACGVFVFVLAYFHAPPYFHACPGVTTRAPGRFATYALLPGVPVPPAPSLYQTFPRRPGHSQQLQPTCARPLQPHSQSSPRRRPTMPTIGAA